MGLKYFGGRSWAEVTREERFFCLRLHSLISDRGVHAFVRFLNDRFGLALHPDANWEVAYEVCFYRDRWHHNGQSGELFSPKRTFDLALFSDGAIVVIEAKAHQDFDRIQLQDFQRDKAQLKKETNVAEVILIGLASSSYSPPECVHECFARRVLTWRELAALYEGNAILLHADAIYRPSAGWNTGANNANGYMSGAELFATYQQGADFWVGRSGGLAGPRLSRDIASGNWRAQKYETNRQPCQPNRNWFMLRDFVKQIESQPSS